MDCGSSRTMPIDKLAQQINVGEKEVVEGRARWKDPNWQKYYVSAPSCLPGCSHACTMFTLSVLSIQYNMIAILHLRQTMSVTVAKAGMCQPH